MKRNREMILFWGDDDIYSNFYPAPFTVDGQRFHSSEQYFMYRKARTFGDETTAAAILQKEVPLRCKELGRSVQKFDAAAWSKKSAGVMFAACYHKFRQNPRLKVELLASCPLLLVEASPFDSIWGIGLDEDQTAAFDPAQWQGENRLGTVLMAVREVLARSGKTRPAEEGIAAVLPFPLASRRGWR